MNRRQFLKRSVIAAGVAACPLSFSRRGATQAESGAKRRPNVLLIITDDQRWDTLSSTGNAILKTPALDRFASGGILFRNAFVTTSTCAPSRASIMTGKYVHSHGAWSIGMPIPEGQRSVFEMLQENGYHTGHVGKWHMTPARRGPVPEEHRRGIDDWQGIGAFMPYIHEDGQYHTEWETEQVLDFLKGREKERPFFLTVGVQAPHRPHIPHPRHEHLFEEITIPPPPHAQEGFERVPEPVKNSGGRKAWAKHLSTPELFQQSVKNYYRQIVGVDEAIDRILKTLDEEGLTDNTLVVFTSDNGYFLGEHGLAEKWFPYEEGIRVPLIVRYPPLTDVQRGTTVDAQALNIDIAPTILDIVGLEIPSDVEGTSLKPLLVSDEGKVQWRKSWLYEYACPSGVPPLEAVRTERWKYIVYFSKDQTVEELFDLEDDPHEINNLSQSPEHKEILEQMRTEHMKLREETNYVFWGTHPQNTNPLWKEWQNRKKGKQTVPLKKQEPTQGAGK